MDGATKGGWWGSLFTGRHSGGHTHVGTHLTVSGRLCVGIGSVISDLFWELNRQIDDR